MNNYNKKKKKKHKQDNVLYATPRVRAIALAAAGAGRTVDYGVIVEGRERNTAGGSLLSQKLRVCAGNVPSHC